MRKPGCFVAMVICGSAGLALSLSWFLYFLPRWKAVVASNIAFEIERRLESCHRLCGSWPEGGNTDILLALRGNNPRGIVFVREDHGFPIKGNAFVDPWDSPLVFRRESDGRPVPVSPGPNRKPGDADDVDAGAARRKAEEIHGIGKVPRYEHETPPTRP